MVCLEFCGMLLLKVRQYNILLYVWFFIFYYCCYFFFIIPGWRSRLSHSLSLSLSRLWSWSHLRDWSWPTWRTSLDPCWILFSLPTEQTGLWMPLSIWDCITSCNTSTNLGIMQGSYLWTSARPSISSCLTFSKLTQLSVPTSICQWITSFMIDRQQLVRLGKVTSRTFTLSTGAPQGCVLSPLLFSLYTNDCISKDPSVKFLKFADDTTVISLIKGWRRVCLQTGGWAVGFLVQS